MAYDKEGGKLYIDRNSPNGGISAEQVARCVGYHKRDANGLYNLSLIAQYGDINMWAKFKFVRSSDIHTTENTWKADDGWCGLSIAKALISESTDVTGIENHFTANQNNGWEYNRPRGIAYNEMFRGDDMDGYHHFAMPFVSGYTMPFKWSKDDGNFDVSFRLTVQDAANADFLSYKDLPFENYYLGIAFVGVENKKVFRLTNEDTIEDSGFTINVDVNNIDTGNYMAYPFFSNKRMGLLDGGFVPASVYTVPNCSATKFEVLIESISIQIQGIFSDFADANGFYSMTYTITIKNNSQLDRKFTNNYIQLRYSGNKFTDPLDSTEKQQELQLGREIEVKANSSESIFGILTSITPALQNNPIIWVSLNSSAILKSAVPMQNIRPEE